MRWKCLSNQQPAAQQPIRVVVARQKDDPKRVPDMGNFKKGWAPGGKRTLTRDFYAYLEAQPLLKAVLAGHIHVTVADRFSSTAVEYVAGGNFLFHGQEITIS